MAQPVWVLSVDLQAKTATFQTGLANAARAARGTFTDIKSGSGEMGGAVSGNMMEARHGVMLLGEEFGVHLPRALSTFLASVGPIGAAMEAAFPFLAIIALAGILVQHLEKIREAGAKLTDDQMKFGTAAQNAFNELDKKLLEAGIKADDLRNNHLAALHDKLKLIDMQSMEELVHTFDILAKAADAVFKDLDSHWYTFGAGSVGAKHALDEFQTKYANLLALGKNKEASDLLAGTRESAQKTLDMMQQYKNSQAGGGQPGDPAKFAAAAAYLDKLGLISRMTGTFTSAEKAAQEQLVAALNDQVTAQTKIAELKKKDASNATTATHNTMNEEAAQREAARITAAQKMAEETIRIMEDGYKKQLEVIRGGERESIAATRQGSQSRLEAIDQAIAEEQRVMGDDTAFYRDLLVQRVQVTRQMSEEAAAQARAAQVEEVSDEEKMRSMQLAALQGYLSLYNSAHRLSDAQRVAEAVAMSELEYQNKLQAMDRQIELLDTTGPEYLAKVKELQDKEKQLVQQHENDIAAIKEKAEEQTNARITAANQRMTDSMAQGLTQSIMRHQTWAQTLTSLSNQVVSGMLENAIKSIMTDDMTKERDAAAAARKAYLAGVSMGGPAGVVLGPIFAAAAFAGVMAFEGGTDSVPGVGRGDVVPAMLTPGEGVVPGGVMDGLRNVARNGGFEGGNRTLVAPRFEPHIHAMDAEGVDRVLTKHQAIFHQHVERAVRKVNH